MAVSIDIEKDFKGFSLRVKFDSTCATMGILGASGSGKSITLRCIAGIETPQDSCKWKDDLRFRPEDQSEAPAAQNRIFISELCPFSNYDSQREYCLWI